MPFAPERGVPFKKDDVRARAAIVRARAAVASDLEALRLDVAGCTACTLCADRQRTVFADGDGSAGVLFVGWAPGSLEEEQGKPFLGRSGKLLTDIIEKGMGLPRSKVMITNDPALLLEDPSKKRACWADIQRAMAELGLGPPGQRSPK